jgi:plasmid stability protein
MVKQFRFKEFRMLELPNLGLKVDDATYHKARIRAAQAGTSVSAMVREFLNREDDEESARETQRIQAMEALYALANQRAKSGNQAVEPLSRDEIYATRLR